MIKKLLIIFSFILLFTFSMSSMSFVEAGELVNSNANGEIFLENLPGLDIIDSNSFDSNSGEQLKFYINWIIRTSVILGSMLAVGFIIFGGITYMTTDSFSGKSEGKEHLTNAIGGLIFLIGGYLIFIQINPNILNIDFSTASGRVEIVAQQMSINLEDIGGDSRGYCEKQNMDKAVGPINDKGRCNDMRNSISLAGSNNMTQCIQDNGKWWSCREKDTPVDAVTKCQGLSSGSTPSAFFQDQEDCSHGQRVDDLQVSGCFHGQNFSQWHYCKRDETSNEVSVRLEEERLEQIRLNLRNNKYNKYSTVASLEDYTQLKNRLKNGFWVQYIQLDNGLEVWTKPKQINPNEWEDSANSQTQEQIRLEEERKQYLRRKSVLQSTGYGKRSTLPKTSFDNGNFNTLIENLQKSGYILEFLFKDNLVEIWGKK